MTELATYGSVVDAFGSVLYDAGRIYPVDARTAALAIAEAFRSDADKAERDVKRAILAAHARHDEMQKRDQKRRNAI